MFQYFFAIKPRTTTDALQLHVHVCIIAKLSLLQYLYIFYQIEAPMLPSKVTTPPRAHDFPLKNGNYNYPNGAGFQYKAKAIRNYLKAGKVENNTYSSKALFLELA